MKTDIFSSVCIQIILSLFLVSCGNSGRGLSVVPSPASVELGTGVFTFDHDTVISVEDNQQKAVADWFSWLFAKPAGFVPNLAYATGQVSADRSQPPVGSTMLLETYRLLGEKWIVEEMYDGLLRWNRWFAEHRMNPSGALCWGSEEIPVLYGGEEETALSYFA